MVVGWNIWERRDMVEATSAASREKNRTGEAAVARGGNTNPSSLFLAFSGPNTCHSDQAGTRAHAISSWMGIGISAVAYGE